MNAVTLGEGNTPLIKSARIGPALGINRLFFKLESCNPSGSYKDRFVSAEVSRIVNAGGPMCVATSSGNTGSSLAAYCARCGVQCVILVNQGVPSGKLAQMQAHGARVLRVKEFATSPRVTEQVYCSLIRLAGSCSLSLVVSAYRYCPVGMAAVESLAEEIVKQCDYPIDHIFVPVGGGGLFTAVCRGMVNTGARPRIHAIQPSGCSTVVAAFERGDSEILPVESETRISGLSVPFDIDASLALEHLRRWNGSGFAVSDEEVFEAQQRLLQQEGIYTEPAGAAAFAGLRQALDRNLVRHDHTIVCLITGHGFKDPESIERAAARYPSALLEAAEVEGEVERLA
ncbi:MAG: threonine synthase [Terriglobia bacterium]